jgi:hypothetical protein
VDLHLSLNGQPVQGKALVIDWARTEQRDRPAMGGGDRGPRAGGGGGGGEFRPRREWGGGDRGERSERREPRGDRGFYNR